MWTLIIGGKMIDTKEIKEAVSKAGFPTEANEIIIYLCDKLDDEKFHYDGLDDRFNLILKKLHLSLDKNIILTEAIKSSFDKLNNALDYRKTEE